MSIRKRALIGAIMLFGGLLMAFSAGMTKSNARIQYEMDLEKQRPDPRVPENGTANVFLVLGLLVAKAMGDLTELKADFLAVEARMATRRFVRRAHRAGQDVYIWTVNDVAWMLLGLSRGVDGLITDKPDLARAVIERRAAMSNAERFLVAQLIRLGASTEALEAETALRP